MIDAESSREEGSWNSNPVDSATTPHLRLSWILKAKLSRILLPGTEGEMLGTVIAPGEVFTMMPELG